MNIDTANLKDSFPLNVGNFQGRTVEFGRGTTILGLDMTTLFQFAAAMENHHVQQARYAPVIKRGVLEHLPFIWGFFIASHV